MSALDHPLTWAAPRPLWRAAGQPGMQPAILRFAQDDVAAQLLGAMAVDPGSISQFVARHETWRTPPGQVATPDLAERVPLPEPVAKNRRALLASAAPKSIAETPVDTPTLKLYQAAHQRHYVATATLACATSGLPDRKLRGSQEQVGMLVRRLLPAKSSTEEADAAGELVEYAWIPGDIPRWHRVSDSDDAVLAPGEELLPVFPLAHREAETINRKTWGGSIPIGRREDYMSAGVARTAVSLVAGQKAALSPTEAPPQPDGNEARLSEFRMDVAEPWKALLRAVYKEADDINNDLEATPNQNEAQVKLRNYQLQMQSWLLLLDFGKFLERHLPKVRAALGSGSAAGLSDKEAELLTWLRARLTFDDISRTLDSGKTYLERLAVAIDRALQPANEAKLEAALTDYVPGLEGADADLWPSFHYMLVGLSISGGDVAADGPFKHETGLPDPDGAAQIAGPDCPECAGSACAACMMMSMAAAESEQIDRLTTMIGEALVPSQEETARALPFAERLSAVMVDTADDAGLFCIRFVHLNKDCGPLHPPTLSQPTQRFRMASFFDPDAPAREIKIMLPRDTSAAGLRKHARGTAFVMSDMLCGQVQRAKGLGLIDLIRQVLPWPLHKDIDAGAGGGCKDGEGADIGMICSLSIPIVTLCALILLMIIVSLLDFIFKWVPWLIACFPVKGLKAKGGSA